MIFGSVPDGRTMSFALLYHEHPDFFYQNADGKPGNKMGDWSDVIDLDYRNKALWDY